MMVASLGSSSQSNEVAEKGLSQSERDDLEPDEGKDSNTNGPMHVSTAAVNI